MRRRKGSFEMVVAESKLITDDIDLRYQSVSIIS